MRIDLSREGIQRYARRKLEFTLSHGVSFAPTLWGIRGDNLAVVSLYPGHPEDGGDLDWLIPFLQLSPDQMVTILDAYSSHDLGVIDLTSRPGVTLASLFQEGHPGVHECLSIGMFDMDSNGWGVELPYVRRGQEVEWLDPLVQDSGTTGGRVPDFLRSLMGQSLVERCPMTIPPHPGLYDPELVGDLLARGDAVQIGGWQTPFGPLPAAVAAAMEAGLMPLMTEENWESLERRSPPTLPSVLGP